MVHNVQIKWLEDLLDICTSHALTSCTHGSQQQECNDSREWVDNFNTKTHVTAGIRPGWAGSHASQLTD
jgi:hypothetical protein